MIPLPKPKKIELQRAVQDISEIEKKYDQSSIFINESTNCIIRHLKFDRDIYKKSEDSDSKNVSFF